MSRTLRILERARADVDDIFDWIVQRSVQGAVSWYLAFRRAIARIELAPESFAEAAEAHALQRPLREAPFKTRRGRTYRIDTYHVPPIGMGKGLSHEVYGSRLAALAWRGSFRKECTLPTTIRA